MLVIHVHVHVRAVATAVLLELQQEREGVRGAASHTAVVAVHAPKGTHGHDIRVRLGRHIGYGTTGRTRTGIHVVQEPIDGRYSAASRDSEASDSGGGRYVCPPLHGKVCTDCFFPLLLQEDQPREGQFFQQSLGRNLAGGGMICPLEEAVVVDAQALCRAVHCCRER